MEKNKTGRIEYLDTARAYLIFLVMLGHVLIVLNPGYDRLLLTAAQEFMASFYMPAFFIIHGVLLENTYVASAPPWRTVLARRARTLLVPYLFFEGVGMVCRRVLYGQSFLTGLSNLLTVRCNVGADWFLPALFMGSLLAVFFGMRQKRLVQVLSICAAIALTLVLPDGQFSIVLGRGLLAYSFIMVGYLGKGFFLMKQMPQIRKTMLALLITTGCSMINMKWGTNDFYSCSVANPLTLLAAGISGTYLILAVARRVSCPFLGEVGRQTLIIMGTHQLVIYAMTALFPAMRGGSLLWGVVLLAAMIAFEVPVVWILVRWFPQLIGRKKKQFA